MATVSIREINIELEMRRRGLTTKPKGRESMLEFTQATHHAYITEKCHEIICHELDIFLREVSRQNSPRLMIFAPPRHGKSELVSRRFPSFALGQCPDISIIAASYSADLSSRMNRDTQRIIDSREYQKLFPGTMLSGKGSRQGAEGTYSRTSDIFEIVNKRGVYRSVGVGGGITGMGAEILIIDDPIKDAKEARSEVTRESVWEWYTSTAYTRLMPGGGVLIILTRWNEDDLAGRLLNRMETGEGDQWRVVSLSAIAEGDDTFRKAGEALCPQRYSLDHLNAIKNAIGPYYWAALYQQKPAPSTGNIFNPDAMPTIDAIPVDAEAVRAWDLAASDNDGDWTVGLKLYRTKEGRFIIGDVKRFQGRPEVVESILKATALIDGTDCRIRFPQDPGQAGKSQAVYFVRLLTGYTVMALPISGDKITRAEPFASQCNVGNVSMLRAAWNDALRDEMRLFPNGKHDDQVDAGADAFNTFLENNSAYNAIGYFKLMCQEAQGVKNGKIT